MCDILNIEDNESEAKVKAEVKDNSQANLTSLPLDLLTKISSNLAGNDVRALTSTCTKLNIVDEDFWREMLRTINQENFVPGPSLKSIYMYLSKNLVCEYSHIQKTFPYWYPLKKLFTGDTIRIYTNQLKIPELTVKLKNNTISYHYGIEKEPCGLSVDSVMICHLSKYLHIDEIRKITTN